DMEAEALRHRRGPFELEPSGRGGCEAHAAHPLPPGGLPCLGFELPVQLGAVPHETRQIAATAELADQSGRMPRGAMCELQALEQQHVPFAALGEVIRDAAPDDAAADDDDAGFLR